MKLGLTSVFKVYYYRASIKYKFNSVFNITSDLIDEILYRNPSKISEVQLVVESWEKKEINNSFFCLKIQDQPPNWHYSQLTNKSSRDADKLWSEIKDFDPELGDIKCLWDVSRFDWIIPLSQQASKGDSDALFILNTWLRDWQKNNAPYLGVNWKCGQEASIRVIHLLTGAFILDQIEFPTPAFINLITAHLKRIEPTISYAIAQNNNHGTSEAAALYIGGGFLVKNGYRIGYNWQKKGEKHLIERVSKLIGKNGTFSQYSLNYHRLMLDTLCFCEFFRNKFNLPLLPIGFYQKAILATNWLFTIIDATSGDGPNVGANDGARIIPLTNSGYRDFRPTIQLAMVLFKSKRAFDKGIWDNQVRWLKLSIPDEKVDPPNSLIADDGGFAIIRCSDIFISLRYPRFKFRPSQNDMLHLDLWINGENILRDGGSYSYNSDSRLMNYFGSISGHNTIQFDNHEPMEKISRFLYVNWLKTNWIEKFANIDGKLSFGAGYTDIFGVKHKRKVDLLQDKLVVTDDITNFKINAIQRWRLIDSDWEFVEKNDKNIFLRSNSKKLFIHVSCTENITNSELTEGLESLFYMKTNNLPVLEVTVVKKCIITTTVSW